MRDNRDQGIVSSMIIFAIVVTVVFALLGCSTTVPVTAKFPEKPKDIEVCPKLETVTEPVKLSELTGTVAKNYNMYYECAVKVETWNEWYEKQKRIFNGVSK